MDVKVKTSDAWLKQSEKHYDDKLRSGKCDWIDAFLYPCNGGPVDVELQKRWTDLMDSSKKERVYSGKYTWKEICDMEDILSNPKLALAKIMSALNGKEQDSDQFFRIFLLDRDGNVRLPEKALKLFRDNVTGIRDCPDNLFVADGKYPNVQEINGDVLVLSPHSIDNLWLCNGGLDVRADTICCDMFLVVKGDFHVDRNVSFKSDDLKFIFGNFSTQSDKVFLPNLKDVWGHLIGIHSRDFPKETIDSLRRVKSLKEYRKTLAASGETKELSVKR